MSAGAQVKRLADALREMTLAFTAQPRNPRQVAAMAKARQALTPEATHGE